uniref:uncharacterized protein LOC120341976 isoform X1 n=1 Tax=Styela clava TaxID=7725 RepID=UPI0019398EB6|nr:uncharacterized protein LOC120341976 isoform X1 [Styela clava]
MGKWPKSYLKYQKEWEQDPEFQDWLESFPGDDEKGRCKVCLTILKARLRDIRNHGRTKKHMKNMDPSAFAELMKIEVKPPPPPPLGNKAASLKMAAHIACHSSILTVDHLSALIKEMTQKRFSLHRTKCSMLIRKVLGPEMHNEFLDDVRNSQYSLVIDESLEPSYEKQLRVVIRYYSMRAHKIVTSFLGLLPLDGGQPDFMVLNFLKQNRLDIGNCCGIATDCNEEICEKNAIIAKILEYNPNIVHVKCMCHSLQICLSKAFRLLPRNLNFMIAETYTWFLHNSVRQQKYKNIYENISVADPVLKILQLPDTEWLSVAPCVNKILDNYDELKLYFQLAQSQENSYTAEILFHMFDDPVNKLYLSFLQPIVNEFSRVYKQTELESGGAYRLGKEYLSLYKRLLHIIVKPDVFASQTSLLDIDIGDGENQHGIASVDFGAKFSMVLTESIMIHPSQIENAKQNCYEFVFALASQLKDILPHNIQILNSMSSLVPSVVLGSKKPRLSSLPFLALFNGDLIQLNNQWRRLETINWQKALDSCCEEFWGEVASHVNEDGEHDFQDLGTFMVALLTLPLTNASVEKVFLQMNMIKSKPRNRMGQQLLENILRVRAYMKRNNICCDDFIPSDKMIDAFRADIYKSEVKQELEIEVITDERNFPQRVRV